MSRATRLLKKPKKKTAIALHELLDKYEAELQSSSPKHKLEIKLFSCNPEDSHTTQSDAIDAAFHIYISYMKAVLPEQVTFDTVSEFRRGFVDSPFISTQGDRPMGTYHLHYYIDGKLEMFTVEDILPKSNVPIQTYYNPRLRFMSPMLYSILITFTQRLQQQHSEMLYYNNGSYNEFSKKVDFKKHYKPLEICCPVTGTYVPVKKATPLLQQERYTRLADKDVAEKPDKNTLDVDELVCYDFPNFGPAPFCDFPEDRKKCLKPRLQQYLHEAGDVLKRMLLIIDDTVQLQIKKHTC